MAHFSILNIIIYMYTIYETIQKHNKTYWHMVYFMVSEHRKWAVATWHLITHTKYI